MIRSGLLLLFVLLVFGCEQDQHADNIADEVSIFFKDNHLDKRTSYLDVWHQNDSIIGKTTSESLAERFTTFVEDRHLSKHVSIDVITPTKAFVRNSVSNSRSVPKHSGELSTQYLMGQAVSILKEDGDWYYIQGPDDYLSWIDGGGIIMEEEASEEWLNAKKQTVQINEYSANTAGGQASIASDLVFGNILGKLDENTYVTPSGTRLNITNPVVFEEKPGDAIENVITRAYSLMGRPYLWGGTSTKGIDCSGFTRTAFMNAGYMLGRDASLQVKEGEAVDEKDVSAWQRGDLLFFGTVRDDGSHRITHVSIHTENGDMIHASERVRVESVNPESSIYNEERANTLLEVRRIL